MKNFFAPLIFLSVIFFCHTCIHGMMQRMMSNTHKEAALRILYRTLSVPLRVTKTATRKTAIIWVPGVCGYAGVKVAQRKIENIKQECHEWFHEHIINNVALSMSELRQLSELLKDNPAVVRMFTDLAVEHVEKIESPALHAIMSHNPEAPRLLTKPVAHHITTMKPDIIMRIMERNPEAGDLFVSAAAENIQYIDVMILEAIIQKQPSSLNFFTRIAAERIDRVPWQTLESLMQKNGNASTVFLRAALKNMRKMNWSVIGKMVVRHPGLPRLLRRLVAVRG